MESIDEKGLKKRKRKDEKKNTAIQITISGHRD
jgi:hypothetical protein